MLASIKQCDKSWCLQDFFCSRCPQIHRTRQYQVDPNKVLKNNIDWEEKLLFGKRSANLPELLHTQTKCRKRTLVYVHHRSGPVTLRQHLRRIDFPCSRWIGLFLELHFLESMGWTDPCLANSPPHPYRRHVWMTVVWTNSPFFLLFLASMETVINW